MCYIFFQLSLFLFLSFFSPNQQQQLQWSLSASTTTTITTTLSITVAFDDSLGLVSFFSFFFLFLLNHFQLEPPPHGYHHRPVIMTHSNIRMNWGSRCVMSRVPGVFFFSISFLLHTDAGVCLVMDYTTNGDDRSLRPTRLEPFGVFLYIHVLFAPLTFI